jgi:hypothetical protein
MPHARIGTKIAKRILHAGFGAAILLNMMPPLYGQNPPAKQSATATVLGSCNLIMQNVQVAEGATLINEVDCNIGAGESFRVRYLWLDEIATSFLVTGHFDSSLKAILGTSQTIVKNEVYQRTSRIVDRFGFGVNSKTDFLIRGAVFSLEGAKKKNDNVEIMTNGTSNIPLAVLRKMKVYKGSENIIWPDLRALRTIVSSTAWPSDFGVTYDSSVLKGVNLRKATLVAQNVAISCVVLYKYISKHELDSYWDEVENLERALANKELKDEDVVNPQISVASFRQGVVDNLSLEAMAYFGEQYWPEDFLMMLGSADANEGCGGRGEYRLGLYASPRRLYTLVAIIEPRASSLEVEGMTYLVDEEEQLRQAKRGTKRIESPPGAISLKRGETAIIPLRNELRYDIDDVPIKVLSNKKDAEAAYTKIMSIPTDLFQFTLQNFSTNSSSNEMKPKALTDVYLKKLKSSYRKPETKKITEAYVFGQSLELLEVKVKGTKVAVREVPAAPLSWIGPIGVGSCPFVFVDDGRGEPSIVGRILIGAHSQSLMRTERITLPKGTKAVFIREIEPEITYIEQISIAGGAPVDELIVARNIRIRPGHSLEFDVPELYRDDPTLIVNGYYEPMRTAQPSED